MKEGSYEEEYRIVRSDGTLRWVLDRTFPVRNEAGEVYRIVGIAEDITADKQAAEARDIKGLRPRHPITPSRALWPSLYPEYRLRGCHPWWPTFWSGSRTVSSPWIRRAALYT
jgi:hypothetical protein